MGLRWRAWENIRYRWHELKCDFTNCMDLSKFDINSEGVSLVLRPFGGGGKTA